MGTFRGGHGDVSPVPLPVGHAKRPRVPRVPVSPRPRRIILQLCNSSFDLASNHKSCEYNVL